MSSSPRDPAEDQSESPTALAWTAPQRRMLIALLFALCAFFAIRYACNRAYVSDPPPPHGSRYDEVQDRIDPNTADVATLSALPLIGEKRAQEIIDYREKHRTSPGKIVFTRVEDLLPIRGFGRASIETLRPYLMFPPPATAAAPTTARAL